MLSIEEFKKHLPKDHGLTEEEIKKVRDIQDGLAEIFFAMWIKERRIRKL